jgi:hypothetical protein
MSISFPSRGQEIFLQASRADAGADADLWMGNPELIGGLCMFMVVYPCLSTVY